MERKYAHIKHITKEVSIDMVIKYIDETGRETASLEIIPLEQIVKDMEVRPKMIYDFKPNFILSHNALSKIKDRAKNKDDNHFRAIIDLRDGNLWRFKNMSVAYQKGIMCSVLALPNPSLHYHMASSYYGGNSLSAFLVPETGKEILMAVV